MEVYQCLLYYKLKLRNLEYIYYFKNQPITQITSFMKNNLFKKI